MKKLVSYVTAVVLIFLCTSGMYGQSEEGTYLKFDYIKVQPNDLHTYMEYMSNTWKPLYQKRVEAGTIESWSLYRVFIPGGDRGSYNFVVITTANSMDPFESMRPRDILIMEDSSYEQIASMMQKANSLRTVMFTEIWKSIINIVEGNPSPHNSKYMMIDYMMVAPGRDYDYQMLEDEFAKPIHEEREAQGDMQAWEVLSLITPGGQNYGYNYATPNYFDRLSNIEYGFTEDVIENALPGTNIPEFFNTIFSTRTRMNSEIWELVDRID